MMRLFNCILSLSFKFYWTLVNFYLNNAEYSNGLQLRNKYAHGVTSCSQSDQKEHESAYYYFLMIFVILLLKMDGDLRLASAIS